MIQGTELRIMPNGELDLADIDFSQPFDTNFVPDLDESEFPAKDKDDDANG
jgi:hypothetical protein